MSYSAEIQALRDRIMNDSIQVMDPPTQHHEFVSGNHGRKLDFDRIPTHSEFFGQWAIAYAEWISEDYEGDMPDALLGVANGANRLSQVIAPILGGNILGLTTMKMDKKTVKVDDVSRMSIDLHRPNFVLVVEDVGTTGSTTATAVNDLLELGIERVEASTTWQRNPTLPRLDELRIRYAAVIPEPLPMYTPEECIGNPDGFCAQGVVLIPHGN